VRCTNPYAIVPSRGSGVVARAMSPLKETSNSEGVRSVSLKVGNATKECSVSRLMSN
jgi:hypothetical protein